MKIHTKIKTYGDPDFRGKCPPESAEQITFFSWLRRKHPVIAGIATHIRNEGKRTHAQTARQKVEGMVAGASDIIIPASPPFVCEMKRKNRMKSTWQKGQREYLLMAEEYGAFACVALGHQAAIEAFTEWITINTIRSGLRNN